MPGWRPSDGGSVGGHAAIIWAGLATAALLAAGAVAAQPPPEAAPLVPPPAPVRDAFPALPVATQPPPTPPDPLPPDPADPTDRFREPPLTSNAPPDRPPGPPGTPDAGLGTTGPTGLAPTAQQRYLFGPRYGVAPNYNIIPDETNKDVTKVVYTGGIIVNITTSGTGQVREVELRTDTAVAWIRSPKGRKASGALNTPIDSTVGGRTEVELYLSGNVEVRTVTVDPRGVRTISEILRANEAYYDATNNKGVNLDAHLELQVPGLPENVRLDAAEIDQLGVNHFEAFKTRLAASKRPSDPGLNFTAARSEFTRERTVRTNVFGVPYRNLRTGQEEVGFEQILTSYSVTPRVFDVPFFYLPRTRVDISEPFGPLVGFATANDRIRGFQVYTTFDLYKLLALRGPPGHRWVLYADYYSARGAAGGTEYDYVGNDLFGLVRRDDQGNVLNPEVNQPYSGLFRAYVLNDTKKNRVLNPRRDVDILGGNRGDEPIPPAYRSRIQFRHNQDVYESGTTWMRLLAQAEYFSDKNFYEQFYKSQFDQLPNQETFAYLYGANGHVGGSLLTQAKLERPYVTETEWLPRADGFIVGQSLLGLASYTARGSAGYAQLRPTTVFPFAPEVTDREAETARFDLMQRLEVPIDAGPIRVTPYGVMDLTYYTNDINNYNGGIPNRFAAGQPLTFLVPPPPPPPGAKSDDRGRFYGAGGVEVSTQVSRLYGDATSELFNVNGLNHKVVLKGNYYAAYSDTPYYRLPQLDRLNDDATDQSYRASRPFQRFFITRPDGQPTPGGLALNNSPLYDTQQYAIRRVLDNKPDTLDSLEVVQVALDQRLQTKRGFPGNQHTVDWMTLNLSGSAFPNQDRDNYGQTLAFLEYNYLWHLGDRTSFTSAGWYDPVDNGPRYYNVGVNFNRPDGTNFYLGYRHTDPVNSRAVTASITYNLNRKYSLNVFSTYDFANNSALSNQVSLARTGADVTLLFGVSYNSLQNNFGLQLALVPNLVGVSGARQYSPALGRR